MIGTTVLTRGDEARVVRLDGRDAVRVHVTRIAADFPAGRIVGLDVEYEGLDAADQLGRLVDQLAAAGWEERPWLAGWVFGVCGHRLDGAVVLAGHTKCGGC
jgi:hypothetical protein